MSSVDLLSESWAKFNIREKRKLLKAHRLNESWAETKSINEMVDRGGGLVAKTLHNTFRTWKERNPNTRVIWK